MPTMKAIQVSEPHADFELVEKEVPVPEANEVLIKVEACGICRSDDAVKDGTRPWLDVDYPRVPGHEVVGTIKKTGNDVTAWKTGQRVGIGWHGGHCFKCEPCRRGDFINCENALVTGAHFDGGYAEYMTAPANALAAVPESLSSAEQPRFFVPESPHIMHCATAK